MNIEQENARLSICSLLDHWSALPTACRALRTRLVEFNWDEEPHPLQSLQSLYQVGKDFVLTVQVPEGDDPEEYCAAVEAFFDYRGLRVEPYKVPGFPFPDTSGYVEVGGSAEPDTYEVGTNW